MATADTPLQLAPLHLPPEPGLWPLAWGWWALLSLVLVLIITAALLWQRKRRHHQAKRDALSQITQIQDAQGAMELTRRAALSYFPRHQVAGLHGQAWFAFLDNQLGEARFAPHFDEWQRALYQDAPLSPQRLDDVRHWLNKALPPKKGAHHA